MNHDERKVYFSVWTDHVENISGVVTYTLQGPHWGIQENGRRSPARNDHDEKFSLVFDDSYEAWVYFVEAKDRLAHPREIGSTRTSFVMLMQLARSDDGWITGVPVRRLEIR